MSKRSPTRGTTGLRAVRSRGHSLSRDVYLSRPHPTTKAPEYAIAEQISEALDPRRAPGRIRTMADMSAEELAALCPPRKK